MNYNLHFVFFSSDYSLNLVFYNFKLYILTFYCTVGWLHLAMMQYISIQVFEIMNVLIMLTWLLQQRYMNQNISLYFCWLGSNFFHSLFLILYLSIPIFQHSWFSHCSTSSLSSSLMALLRFALFFSYKHLEWQAFLNYMPLMLLYHLKIIKNLHSFIKMNIIYLPKVHK